MSNEIEKLEQKIKNLERDKKNLLENTRQKDICFKNLDEKYKALRNNEYRDTDGRERIYVIELMAINTNSVGAAIGSTYSEATTTDLQFAKLIELALQKIFDRRSVSISTSMKKDMYSEKNDNTWIGV